MTSTIFLGGSMGAADEFAAGGRDVMDAFMSAWKSVPAIWNVGGYTGCQPKFDGHETRFWNGLFHGVRTVNMEQLRTPEHPGIRFGGLADVEMLSGDTLLALLKTDIDTRPPDDTDRAFLDALTT